MEFYQLEAFVTVVGHRSFSRTAEILFLSQPTVSAHVKTLEKVSVFDNQETIKQAVRQGVGLTREFWLVYHQKRVLSPAVSALYANLKAFFRREAR